MTSRNRRAAPALMAVAKAVAAAKAPVAGAVRATKPRKRTDEVRLAELKTKLRDEDYMNGAILRIATVLSSRLTLR
jgi:hypothetical protein